MKVQLTLDVDARTRYVIAKYFAKAGGRDETRTRATRPQVRRFAAAALQLAVKEHAAALRRRQRTTAERLGRPAEPDEILETPWEWQGTLPL